MAKDPFRIDMTRMQDFVFTMDPRGPFGPPVRSREEELEAALRDAGAQLEQLRAFVEKLKSEPNIIGTVVSVTGPSRGLVSARGLTIEVNLPDGCAVGSQVRMLMTTNQPLSAMPAPVVFGSIVTVDRVHGAEVHFSAGAESKSATVPASLGAKPESGDRVQLDPSGMVVLRNLGRDHEEFSAGGHGVTWDDIGGLADAKEALREAIEYPHKFADVFARYGQRPSRGVLLYGPPGCGKTLLGKAAATSLGDPSGFMYVKGAEVLSKWVGESESTVRAIFDRARDYKRKTGHNAVVFIDEADALLAPRGEAGLGVASMTVPSFLAEMDGLEESGAFVMLSTNRPDSLDPAIVRDGRIDRRIKVGRPDSESAEQVLRIALRGRPCDDADGVVAEAMALMYSDALALYELLFDGSHRELVCLRDLLSGAVIAGFVNRAATRAIRRDRLSGKHSGLTAADICDAIRESFREMADVHNIGAVVEKAEGIGKFPKNVRKAEFYAGSEEAHFGPTVEFGRGGVQAAGGGAVN
jgi:proteasome-associated ATPase